MLQIKLILDVFSHHSAVNAEITVLNEVGVDPGIDHMLAMECFDEVKHAGGKVSGILGHSSLIVDASQSGILMWDVLDESPS